MAGGRPSTALSGAASLCYRSRKRRGGRMPDKQLGFIGVGRMGIHMAGRLLDAGYAVTVFDTNETAMQRLEQRGAKRASSAADVASKCETVLVSLSTPEREQAVAHGQDGVNAGSQAKN